MYETLEYLPRALLLGVGATAFMDGVSALRKSLFEVPAADYGLVGRWLAYVARGRFRHDAIGKAPRVRGERLIGWTAHYLIGISFATVLLAIWGPDWACRPTISAAIVVGIGSVVAPFLIMQPGMRAGIAASRTPNPSAARRRSLITHATFGIGLYLAGLAVSSLDIFHCGDL